MGSGRWCVIALIGVVSCVDTTSVSCGDGRVCPVGTECATLTTLIGTERNLCVQTDQRTACDGKGDGESCELADAVPGACHQGLCVDVACGNGLLDPGEACDDENVSNDDDCSEDCRSTLVCGNGVLDMSRGEQCDVGDAIGHDGCASTCQSERPSWIELGDARPSPRDFAALAYDSARHRTILFGGATRVGSIRQPLGDVSEWDGTQWRAAPSATAPTARYAHTMVYDAARDQLVVFSGVNNQADTWVTVGGVWQQRATAHAPGTRDYAAMAYDAARKQVVLFGGFSPETQGTLDDTWVWDGDDWHEVTPATHPSARLGAAMAYDPRRNVVVMFGGGDSASVDEVWEFDGVTWTDRTPAAGPSPRAFAAMAYDPVSGEILMTGGNDGTTPSARDAATWNGTRWLSRDPLPITASDETFFAHAMATDPVRGRVVVLETKYGVLYEWDGSGWSAPEGASPGATVPLAREGAAMALDPIRDEVVMFGGYTTEGFPIKDDTFVTRGAGWHLESPATVPPARWKAAIAYDEVRREVVMYGGCGNAGALADTWVWRAGDWVLKDSASPPGPRCEGAMAFDAKRGNIVLVAGNSDPSTFATTTWTWDGETWTSVATTSPPARGSPAIAYDRVREQTVLFGGSVPFGASAFDFNDTWSWDGSAWIEVHPVTVPPQRTTASMAWDPARARAVLVAGQSTEGNFTYSDAYEWDGTNWDLLIAPYPARRNAAVATAPSGAGILMYGGNAVANTSSRLDSTLRLRWDGDVSYEACGDRDSDGDGLAGCDDLDCWWACTPTCPPGTACAAGGPSCGDTVCNPALESCVTCATDCGACPVVCGDFTCAATETLASCPGDCTP